MKNLLIITLIVLFSSCEKDIQEPEKKVVQTEEEQEGKFDTVPTGKFQKLHYYDKGRDVRLLNSGKTVFHWDDNSTYTCIMKLELTEKEILIKHAHKRKIGPCKGMPEEETDTLHYTKITPEGIEPEYEIRREALTHYDNKPGVYLVKFKISGNEVSPINTFYSDDFFIHFQ